MRDLLVALGHERATFVGHSLGGGVAMQLAYQFPERCERLVLVDSGGLGPRGEHAAARGHAARRGVVLPLLASEPALDAGRGVGRLFGRLGLRVHTDIAEMARGHASLAEPRRRAAFVHTLRTIVDPRGQRVNANDRLYLAEEVPFLIIWGSATGSSRWPTRIAAHERVPSSRLEIFEDAGHFPHVDEPAALHRGADGLHRRRPSPRRSRRSAGGRCFRRASRRGRRGRRQAGGALGRPLSGRGQKAFDARARRLPQAAWRRLGRRVSRLVHLGADPLRAMQGLVAVVAVELDAELIRPAGVGDEVGRVEDSAAARSSASPSWASWLLAAPQTIPAAQRGRRPW